MLEQLLQHYGYLALLVGTFFEGEAVLVLAGFLAFREYLDIRLVILVAFIGSYAGDQLWYFLGRRHGRALLQKRPHWQHSSERALRHLRRHPDLWALGFRFVYGLRTVMPVAIGVSGYSPWRFLLINGIGAAIWSLALGAAAYHFGNALEVLLGDLRRYELYVLLLVIAGAALLWWRRRRHARTAAANDAAPR